MSAYKVGYLVGSLARGSINRKLAQALVRLAPEQLELTEVAFRDLPLYSYDYDADFPMPARAFKDAPTDRTRSRVSRRRSLGRRRERSARPSRNRTCAASSPSAMRR